MGGETASHGAKVKLLKAEVLNRAIDDDDDIIGPSFVTVLV